MPVSSPHLTETSKPAEKSRENFHVVLIRGPILCSVRSITNEATPPLALAFLAGYLRHLGYRVSVIDSVGMGLNNFWKWDAEEGFCCQGLTFEEILKEIPIDADLFAFTCMFSGEWPSNRDLIKMIREKFPNVPTVAGGEHATAAPEYSLRDCPALDLIAPGEGEQILFDLCEQLRKGENGRKAIGVKYIDELNNYIDTGPFPRIQDIDKIPWPAWDLASLEPYWKAQKSHGTSTFRDMPLMVSRGCPYQCTFCSNPQMWTTRYVLRNVDDVLDQIEFYIKKYGITGLQFYDLTAITKKSWTLEFCNKMIARGINLKWSLPSGTRSEVLDEDVLPLLAKTNCIYLVYAPESGSPDTLKMIKKRIDLDRFNQSIKTALKNGLTVRINLIIGFPHETHKHIWETILYGWKIILMGVEEAVVNIFSPYPGSELFNELYAENKIQMDDAYFYSMTSLNGDYTNFKPVTFCRYVKPWQLAVYRVFSMTSNYIIGYLFFPRRIFRTLKGFIKPGNASTVFEHRMQDLFKRKWINRKEQPGVAVGVK